MTSTNKTTYQQALTPWILYFLREGKFKAVARFRKRNDAEQHSIVLKRLMPKAQFLIAFELPEQIAK